MSRHCREKKSTLQGMHLVSIGASAEQAIQNWLAGSDGWIWNEKRRARALTSWLISSLTIWDLAMFGNAWFSSGLCGHLLRLIANWYSMLVFPILLVLIVSPICYCVTR